MNAAVAPINIALFVCVHTSVKLCVVSLSVSLSSCVSQGLAFRERQRRAGSNEGWNGEIVGISIPQRGKRRRISASFTNTKATCSFLGDREASSFFCIYLLSIRIVLLWFYSVAAIKWPLLRLLKTEALNEDEQSGCCRCMPREPFSFTSDERGTTSTGSQNTASSGQERAQVKVFFRPLVNHKLDQHKHTLLCKMNLCIMLFSLIYCNTNPGLQLSPPECSEFQGLE